MKNEGTTAYTLKMIALITMILDHIGAVVVWRIMDAEKIIVNLNDLSRIGSWSSIAWLYFILKTIGRIAFPVYLFLMVQGIEHTKSPVKYMANVGVFALISEIPYDMAFYLTDDEVFSGHLFNWKNQNIMIELLIVLFMFSGIKKCNQRIKNPYVRWPVTGIVIAIAAGLSILAKSGYSYWGILAAAIMYILRSNPAISYILGAGLLMIFNGYIGIAALLVTSLVAHYYGEKGKAVNKYVFYAAYPVHLLLLWGYCIFNGYMK